MNREELLKHFKYFNQEDTPPTKIDATKRIWWEGERELYELCANNFFWLRLTDSFIAAEKRKELSGKLIDKSIPEVQRIIIFFLDIWHGKHFSYDSLDEINNY
ncbi:MAG: hypothetical protein IJ816_02330 [Alloprevotella sp.]|nr:hypothetical protein [Alloprevotella sp.]